jgi:ribosomal-protein-alanine N-acetyltransferase
MGTEPKRVRVVTLGLDALVALAEGDPAAASALTGLEVGSYLVEERSRSTWQRRVAQVAEDPSVAQWVTGLVLDTDLGVVVGRGGFHGPPDQEGRVEIGYAIDPRHRRQGYARAVARELLGRAAREPDVRVVRASIRPDNAASLATIAGLGFVEVGEQWDDEDGLELLFEVSVATRRPVADGPGRR